MERRREVSLLLKRLTALLALVAVLVASAAGVEDSVVSIEIRYNATSDTFSVDPLLSELPIAASVSTNFTFYDNGWDVVFVEGAESFMNLSDANRLIGYRAAGFGEGFLNFVRIFQNYNNSFFGDEGVDAALRWSPGIPQWIEAHRAYLVERSQVGDAIGKQLGGLLALMEGLAEGYAAANTDPHKALNATQFFWLNFQAEIFDLVTAFGTSDDFFLWAAAPHLDPRPKRHCSALVKVLADDVYFSHVTWSSFNSMMRQYKTYKFENRSVTMSGYPGMIHSLDDWYMTSAGRLAVMETTNGVYNNSLFVQYVRNGTNTISEFLRVMIANFLSYDAPQWVTLFSTENSGTYNNQWMVFDMKLFTPGGTAPLPPNTFWVAEQLPGFEYPFGVTAADKTSVLNNVTYWASYNLPYFPNVYDVSGNYELYLLYGDFFSYTNYSRAEIFRRNQSVVVDLASMQALMRYNNFETDPLSRISNCVNATDGKCSPPYSAMLAIASRGDLNPPGGEAQYGANYQYLSRRNHCGTDAKIALWSKMVNTTNHTFTGVIINGPTSYQQPVFSWSTSPFANRTEIVRQGLPDTFNFPFIEVAQRMPQPIPTQVQPAGNNQNHAVAIGLGVAGAVVAVGIVAYLVVKARNTPRHAEVQTEGAHLLP